MKYAYGFAGMTVEVTVQPELVYRDDRLLRDYVSEATDPDYTMTLETAKIMPPPEGQCVYQDSWMRVYQHGMVQTRYKGPASQSTDDAYIMTRREGTHSLVLLREDSLPFTSKTILDAMEAEHRIVEQGGFILHASCVEHEGGAILFTAPSGTGKSTQARLWQELRGAEIINGDRIAVLCDNGIHAAGIPYSGSSGISKNVILPLRAIVYLAQAPQTTIRNMRGREAFCRVWEGISVNAWDPAEVDRCAQTVSRVVSGVPIYYLACTPDESAVGILEETLTQQGRQE